MELVRPLQVHPATLREVEAIDYVVDGVATGSQLGGLEQHDGAIWLVCGIYEPAEPHAPWAIAYVARRGPDPVLRTPSVLVAQDLVTRVHDGID